jgi:hypothetical protein
MRTSDYHIQQLRALDYFTFAFLLTDEQKALPPQQQRAILKTHFEKLLDCYFQPQPRTMNYKNEVERF